MDYNDYSAGDLAADSSFRQWVLQPDRELDQFWTTFLAEYPHQAPIVARAVQMVRQLNQATTPEQPAVAPAELDAIWQTIHPKISEETNEQPTPGRIVRFNPQWIRWVAAAGIALAVSFGWWLTRNNLPAVVANRTGPSGAIRTSQPLRERINDTADPVNVELSDGSTVTLQPNSRLSYPEQFAISKREVNLVGEAFFQVTRNPARPFIVYAGEIVTKVLGTSFRVRAYERDKTVSVVVRTGRVSVFSRRNFARIRQPSAAQVAGLLLTPNQRATFYRASEQLAKDLIEQPLPLPAANPKTELVFDDQPVSVVLVALEKQYGLDIVFDEQTLSHCPITTTLSNDEGLHQRLGRICRAIGATYDVVDGQIIINSTGCTL